MSQLRAWGISRSEVETASERQAPPRRRSGSGTYAAAVVSPPVGLALPESEHARFAELHRSLIANVRRVLGDGPAFCYCGDYLATGLAVGSASEGQELQLASPLNLGELLDICGNTELAPGITTVEHSPLAAHCIGHSATAPPSAGRVAWLLLAAQEQVLGVVGALVAEDQSVELAREGLAELEKHCSSFADIFLRHQELNRWVDVTDHLVSFDGICAVVDTSRGDLLWIGARSPHLELQQELRDSASALAGLVARSANRVESDPPVSYPLLNHGTIVHVQTEKSLSTFGSARLAVVAIRPHFDESDDENGSALSRREHQVSRLLVDGYTIVNAAAILGLTENTVRTYVRRLYRKLGVSTRADLVRQLHARLG